jgi:TPP-dependent pyruvate/acetoin dehydrogenase alpha subunit
VKGGRDAVNRLHEIDRASRARIDAAVRFALDSPLPSASTALDHVFA